MNYLQHITTSYAALTVLLDLCKATELATGCHVTVQCSEWVQCARTISPLALMTSVRVTGLWTLDWIDRGLDRGLDYGLDCRLEHELIFCFWRPEWVQDQCYGQEELNGSPLHKLALIFQCIGMLWGTPGMPPMYPH
jgi:hypothetical protein